MLNIVWKNARENAVFTTITPIRYPSVCLLVIIDSDVVCKILLYKIKQNLKKILYRRDLERKLCFIFVFLFSWMVLMWWLYIPELKNYVEILKFYIVILDHYHDCGRHFVSLHI